MPRTNTKPAEPHTGETTLIDSYSAVRAATEAIASRLSDEDCVVQSMPDASPTKWHLAHTTWFYETFVLSAAAPDYPSFDPTYGYLFNSYYNAVGPMHPRPQRGMLTRPSMDEVLAYRRHVDARMRSLLGSGLEESRPQLARIVTLGLHHEQQHQELALTDIKHAFSCNPLEPAYLAGDIAAGRPATALTWTRYPEGVTELGHDGDGFSFDNESPRHRRFVAEFELASRPANNGELAAFIADGGYRRPELWLSEGWTLVEAEGWRAPLYWRRDDGSSDWTTFTLRGRFPVDPAAPACHLSFYEADAFARWSGARLPSEAEWEIAALQSRVRGNFFDSGVLHPVARVDGEGDDAAPYQLFGDVWEWTASAYSAYPGYRPSAGALGEYNGKFMSNQMVLRGGSCASSQSHLRASYRNFFYPQCRWQFSGLRLARDTDAPR